VCVAVDCAGPCKKRLAPSPHCARNRAAPQPQPLTAPLHAAVVGAGPAGITAAIYLANRGWRVDVFERRREDSRSDARRTYLIGLGALAFFVWGLVWFGLVQVGCTVSQLITSNSPPPFNHACPHPKNNTPLNPGKRGLQSLQGAGVQLPDAEDRRLLGSVYATPTVRYEDVWSESACIGE